MKNPGVCSRILVSSLCLIIMGSIFEVDSRPPVQQQTTQDLDIVDLCILNCDSCFKGDALVKCANECITGDGSMGAMWSHLCHHFALVEGYVNTRLRN